MRRKLTRIGSRLALVLDKQLLDRVGIDADTPIDVSTNGQKIVVETHTRYAGVFRRLAE